MSVDVDQLRAWLTEAANKASAERLLAQQRQDLGWDALVRTAQVSHCRGEWEAYSEVLRWLDENASPAPEGDTAVSRSKSWLGQPVKVRDDFDALQKGERGVVVAVDGVCVTVRLGHGELVTLGTDVFELVEGDTEEQGQRGPSTSDCTPPVAPNGATALQRAVNQALRDAGSPRRINSHVAAAAVHAMKAMGWSPAADTEKGVRATLEAAKATISRRDEMLRKALGAEQGMTFRQMVDSISRPDPGDTETVTLYRQNLGNEWCSHPWWSTSDRTFVSAEFTRTSPVRPALPSEGDEG